MLDETTKTVVLVSFPTEYLPFERVQKRNDEEQSINLSKLAARKTYTFTSDLEAVSHTCLYSSYFFPGQILLVTS